MPHEQMNEKQVAAYLHMDLREVEKLASRGRIPCRRIGGKHVFHKGELDQWVESHMHELSSERLAGIEKGVSKHHGFNCEAMVIRPMIPPGGLAVPLGARTRDAAIRSLVGLADHAGLIYARDDVIREVTDREKLCSTALVKDVALPHPRHPLPYDIASSFVVVGMTSSGVPFGAHDGGLTRLFFLICCKDDRTHLHVLSRLGLMLQQRKDIERMLECSSPNELLEILEELEKAAIAKP